MVASISRESLIRLCKADIQRATPSHFTCVASVCATKKLEGYLIKQIPKALD